jgi:hypothetical protein
MQPIDDRDLALVHGGFGAILGALLQAAPGIINSVSGLVSASRSGGSPGGGATATAQAGPAQPPQQMASASASTASAACTACVAPLQPAPMSMSSSIAIG